MSKDKKGSVALIRVLLLTHEGPFKTIPMFRFFFQKSDPLDQSGTSPYALFRKYPPPHTFSYKGTKFLENVPVFLINCCF